MLLFSNPRINYFNQTDKVENNFILRPYMYLGAATLSYIDESFMPHIGYWNRLKEATHSGITSWTFPRANPPAIIDMYVMSQ